METSKGKIVLKLDSEKAPETVKNFLSYVTAGFYNGTIFHRVIDGFMIQGGGFAVGMEKKETKKPVKNEASNGLANKAMTIAMARTNDPDSATSQFFINLVDNGNLNYGGPTKPGYTVFGEVVKGQDVVAAIGKVETGTQGYFNDVPKEAVVIQKVKFVDE